MLMRPLHAVPWILLQWDLLILQKLANKNKSTIVLFIPINAYLYAIPT